MKKLVMMMAVVAMVTVTQAAAFSWKISTGSDYEGMNVYCIQGTSAAAVISAFSATDDASKWSSVVKGVTPMQATTGKRGAAAGVADNVSDGDKLVFAIINGDIAEGNNWFVLSDYTVPEGTTYVPPTSGATQTIAVGTPAFGTFTIKAGPDPSGVPEPTSGLLLVLGGAALALRRKQK